ncbi:MAG: oligosaccharide flippase family protein [Verrucomicrobiota bacterium]|jgi:O-antigen/teichoic acid export membrane protein
MPVERVERRPGTEADDRAAFFRQSGWLMLANVGGGALMWAVHFLSRTTGPAEYGLFVTFLSLAMCIPTGPLQTVMAQQTAKALATNRQGELAGLTRLVWLGTLGLWLMGAVVVWVLQNHILAHWKVSNPAGLWITVTVLLWALWVPLFQGVLQGQQNFLWLGWSIMSNAIGRVAVAAVAVLALGGLAAGMMTGVLLGMAAAVLIAVWQTRRLWLARAQPFDWRGLLRQVVPLMLGCGAVQFLFTADPMFVKSYFSRDEEVGFYDSAGTLARALMWLVMPLATVMFPRLVHSTARGEKTDIMGLALVGTAILSVVGAVGLSVVGPLAVRIVNGQRFVAVASALLPWYAAAMVPLALANVLVNALFARSCFRIVPPLCVLALAYAFALTRFHDTFVMVLKTLGVFNLLLLALCAWFTWADKASRAGPQNS